MENPEINFDQQAFINQLVNDKLVDILTQNIPDVGTRQMIREFFKVFTAHGIAVDEAFTITYELTLILQKHTSGEEDKNV